MPRTRAVTALPEFGPPLEACRAVTQFPLLWLMPQDRRFPPPLSVEETDACFIVRDANRLALAYVYFEEEPGRRAAAFSPKTTPVCGFT